MAGTVQFQTGLAEANLTTAHFERIATLLYTHCGIKMRAGKEGLVKARLTKRLRALGLSNFDSYIALIERNTSGGEFVEMIDALTTNKTSFFRENAHFDYLRNTVLSAGARNIRIWSAGCSTGEEAYTLAMVLRENLPASVADGARILATDISSKVLETARAGIYSEQNLAEVPPALVKKYWREQAGRSVAGERQFAPVPQLTSMIKFGKLNLMEPWPIRGPFDAVLCRNVMIYFDKPTQQSLVDRYWSVLKDGGHLFVGHSESLTGLSHKFRYVQPAVYVR